ncbi:MAG: TatD family hydrolase [Microthrixaceae bacterium]
MSRFPPVDLHAHVDPAISADDLDDLRAVVFAVTRSLDEAASVVDRTDANVVWGVGCHPGLAKSHRTFNAATFEELLRSVPFAGELGLDGSARVPMDRQQATFRTALTVLKNTPRIVSIHSAGATREVLDELERSTIRGAVLHWWLGDGADTHRAVDLGCYFSLNIAGVRRSNLLDFIPPDRLLTETDHPFGDKRSKPPQPGNVENVEAAIARHHNLQASDVRRLVWRNLSTMVAETKVGGLFPRPVRRLLAAS